MTTENNTQATESQEVMKFPMEFPIKIMGLNDEAFPKAVNELLSKHFEDFDPSKNTISYSKTKKYMSVNVVVNAQSRAQLDDIYRALTAHPMVKIAL